MQPVTTTASRPEPVLRLLPSDPTQELLREIKDTSPWLYEVLRSGGLILDEDLPTITYEATALWKRSKNL